MAGESGFLWKDKSGATNNVWHPGEMVSGNYFDGLGVRPAIGRTITPADDAVESSGGPDGPVAVLSYNFWRRTYHLDPGAIGKQVNVNGAWLTVVGVMPPEFFGTQVGTSPDIFVPMQLQPVVDPPNNVLHDSPRNATTWIAPFVRVNGHVTETQAVADLNVIYRRYVLSRLSPAAQAAYKSKSKPASGSTVLLPGGKGLSRLREQFSQPLRLLMASVGVVLLLACVNIATLLLARSDARRSEIGVRLAIGASRSRLIRQLLTESLLLSMLGGALSLLFAVWISSGLVRMLPHRRRPWRWK
jgi:macrolide transport system ATP-binding/permease protein